MRGALLRNFHLYTRNIHFFSRNFKPASVIYNDRSSSCCKNYYAVANVQSLNNFPSKLRFFSSENGYPDPDSKPESESSEAKSEEKKAAVAEIEDVDPEELKKQIKDYFQSSNDGVEDFTKIMKSLLNYAQKNEDKLEAFQDELEEMELSDESDSDSYGSVADGDLTSDFEEGHETDDEIGQLCDAEEVLMKRKASDPYFNMDDKKWDDFVKEAMEQEDIQGARECEHILEDLLIMDKLPRDEIQKKMGEKFHEIGDRVERGELSVEEGSKLFKEFEDQLVMECAKQGKAEGLPEFVEDDDSSSVGPTLRWQTRVVFVPGTDSWHPKNRKVKLATTVKEYGLSKAQFVRLRELVGKRYNPAKDELTIISERFEHREENRKDCLRTLLDLMEEARKADDLVHEARVSDIKNRLKANPKFMQRLLSKKQPTPVAA